jgi:hypothetical protein
MFLRYKKYNTFFDVRIFFIHGSVHRESMLIIVRQDATIYSLLYFCKQLYMFWVVTPPIIRSYGGEVGTAVPTSPP